MDGTYGTTANKNLVLKRVKCIVFFIVISYKLLGQDWYAAPDSGVFTFDFLLEKKGYKSPKN